MIAVACGLLASLLMTRYIGVLEGDAKQAKIDLQSVAVAAGDIPIGTRIDMSLLAKREWPKAGIPQGAVFEPEAALGRLARGEIARGEPILEHRLFPKDLSTVTGVMSVLVPEGKRAMAVGVNEVIGVSGFILPKDRVDVIATRTDQPMTKSTETILHNIEVLAVGKRLEQEGKQNVEVPTVTLAVSPEEAERLAKALQEGKIHIALRSFMDRREAQIATVRHESALGGKTGGRLTMARAKGGGRFIVDAMRGDKRVDETYAVE